jgi:hypothetical protein
VRARRRSGFALADFIAGSLILAGAVGAWASLTRAQIDAAALVERRTRALYAAEEALARGRSAPAAATAAAAKSTNGAWVEVERFAPRGLVAVSSGASGGVVEARPLAAKASFAPPAAVELRARLEWRGDTGPEKLELGSIVIANEAAPRREEKKPEEPKKPVEPKKPEPPKPEEPKKPEPPKPEEPKKPEPPKPDEPAKPEEKHEKKRFR